MTSGLVLDTHVWIWFMNGDPALGGATRDAIVGAAENACVLVPAIAVWELSMLDAKRRISLSTPCEAWVATALSQPGVVLAPLTPEIAILSNRLPDGFHGDPADRIIVATARALDAALLTRDRRILTYGRRGHVRTIAA